MDSAVANVDYVTSSGINGTTNDDGEYQYKSGDTVTFSIGDLEFPSVTATGTVTPLTMAGTDDTSDPVVINITRLLQTLDQDGEADNGITITDTAKAAATAVDFDQSVDDFASDSAVLNLISNAGQDEVITELVDADEAIANLEESLTELAATSVVGVWSNYISDSNFVYLVLLDDGTLIYAEDDPDAETSDDPTENGSDQNGVERGTYTYDSDTGKLKVSLTFDENTASDGSGIGEIGSTSTFTLSLADSGASLVVEEANFTLTRETFDADSIEGFWSMTDGDSWSYLGIFADGHLMYVEYDEDYDYNGMNGLEMADYSYDGGTGITSVTVFYDDNTDYEDGVDTGSGIGDLGITESYLLSLSDDADTLAIDGVFDLQREL
ncbi:hypothetical protein [Oceanobacter mangrovi]|uniref:hypothetical protein n=1 Tax=Oceanobacter mangrovi TaxID=2862510 RepID=UPI001C8E69CB|nr:hypothetical protein [Oceanobacter mangrovi]